MNENLFETGKVFGVSSVGLVVGNFSALDHFLNSGILTVTFLYAVCKFVAWVIDRLRKNKQEEKDKK